MEGGEGQPPAAVQGMAAAKEECPQPKPGAFRLVKCRQAATMPKSRLLPPSGGVLRPIRSGISAPRSAAPARAGVRSASTRLNPQPFAAPCSSPYIAR